MSHGFSLLRRTISDLLYVHVCMYVCILSPWPALIYDRYIVVCVVMLRTKFVRRKQSYLGEAAVCKGWMIRVYRCPPTHSGACRETFARAARHKAGKSTGHVLLALCHQHSGFCSKKKKNRTEKTEKQLFLLPTPLAAFSSNLR